MLLKRYLKTIKRIIGGYLFRAINLRSLPWHMVFFVTYKCQAKCKMCDLWKIYRKYPQLAKKEMSAKEYKKFLPSIGNLSYVSIVGGEPFARNDLSEICKQILTISKPLILAITTNGLRTDKIIQDMKAILKKAREMNTKVYLQFSLDGARELHDEIRGFKGIFEALMNTYERISVLRKNYSNLKVSFQTAVSKFNIKHIDEIYKYVSKLEPDSHGLIIASGVLTAYPLKKVNRKLLNNGVIPTTNILREKKRKHKIGLKTGKIATALRNIQLKMYSHTKRLFPCFATFSTCEIDPFGNLHACPNKKHVNLGNLREVNYDFKKIWFGKKIDNTRKLIRMNKCIDCPGVCTFQVSALNNPKGLLMFIREYIKLLFNKTI